MFALKWMIKAGCVRAELSASMKICIDHSVTPLRREVQSPSHQLDSSTLLSISQKFSLEGSARNTPFSSRARENNKALISIFASLPKETKCM